MTAPIPGNEPPGVGGTGPGWGALAAVAVAAIALWSTRGPIPLEPLAIQLTTVLVLAVLSLAAIGAGLPLVRSLPGSDGDPASTRWTLALTGGVACLMLAAALLAIVHLLNTAALGAVLALAALAGAWHLTRRRWLEGAGGLRPPVAPGVLLGAAALATFPVLAAFLPMYDTLNYHLGMPYQWLRAGHLLTFPRDVYSFLPSNVGLLYTYALGLVGPWAAQAVHWWLGAVTLLGVLALGRRLPPSRAGWWGAALLATTPALLMVSTVAYTGLGATAFAAAAWVLAARGAGEPSGRLRGAALAGVAAGLAFGCKYTAGPSLVAPLLLVLLLTGAGGGSWRRRLASGALFAAGATAAFLPWAARNLIETGNPVFPYFGKLWAALGVAAAPSGAGEIARGLGGFPDAAPPLARVLSLGAAGVPAYGGLAGPLFLALLPVTLWFVVRHWRSDPVVRVLAVGSLLAYAGWFLGPPLGRYLLVAMVPMAALTGAGIAHLMESFSPRLTATVVGGLLFVALWNVTGSLDATWPRRMAVALGQEPSSVLLERYASYWPAVKVVDERLPGDARILLVAEARTLYWRRDIVVEDPFHRPLLVELAEREPSEEAMARSLRAMGVTHLFVNRVEARRIARMVGRPAYLETSTKAAHLRLVRFLETELRPVWKGSGLTLYALRGAHTGS